jgi:hypothetical protein
MPADPEKFVIRTREGLLIGPFFSYANASEFAGACRFEVDDIYKMVWPRIDMLGPKVANTKAGEKA